MKKVTILEKQCFSQGSKEKLNKGQRSHEKNEGKSEGTSRYYSLNRRKKRKGLTEVNNLEAQVFMHRKGKPGNPRWRPATKRQISRFSSRSAMNPPPYCYGRLRASRTSPSRHAIIKLKGNITKTCPREVKKVKGLQVALRFQNYCFRVLTKRLWIRPRNEWKHKARRSHFLRHRKKGRNAGDRKRRKERQCLRKKACEHRWQGKLAEIWQKKGVELEKGRKGDERAISRKMKEKQRRKCRSKDEKLKWQEANRNMEAMKRGKCKSREDEEQKRGKFCRSIKWKGRDGRQWTG